MRMLWLWHGAGIFGLQFEMVVVSETHPLVPESSSSGSYLLGC